VSAGPFQSAAADTGKNSNNSTNTISKALLYLGACTMHVSTASVSVGLLALVLVSLAPSAGMGGDMVGAFYGVCI
jgi:hypothetical protein